MPNKLTDAEVICGWMEPKPVRIWPQDIPDGHWWSALWSTGTGWSWIPATLDLDALHEVEARLSEDEWWIYLGELHVATKGVAAYAYRHLIHATAAQKIAALAAVLRREVTDAE